MWVLTRCSTCVLSCVQPFLTPWTWSTRLLCPWDFSCKNTGVGWHFLLQGIFLTQRLNPSLWHLLHWRQILYQWANWGRLMGFDIVHTNLLVARESHHKCKILPSALTHARCIMHSLDCAYLLIHSISLSLGSFTNIFILSSVLCT